MRKQIIYTLLSAALLISIIAYFKYRQIKTAMESGMHGPPPEAVTSIIASEQNWPDVYNSIGSLRASRGVVLKAENPGRVKNIFIESGEVVEQGKIILELDAAVEEADLKGAQASLHKQRKNFERSQNLIGRSAISQAEYELALAQLKESEAQVASLEARIKLKKIVAPFSGHTGIRTVNVGQYLSTGDQVIPLYTLDPLYVDFSLPQKALPDLTVGLEAKIVVDVFPNEEFLGKLTAINPQINEINRNVELQVSIPNPNQRLRPGMFVRIELVLPKSANYITIPASSVYSLPYADTVYVIVNNMKNEAGVEYRGVRQQIVKLGPRRGNQAAIVSGLNVGDEVVTTGAFKLRPGLAVNVNNELAPSNDPAPKVSDS